MELGGLFTPWETLGPQERMKLVLERRAARQAAMTIGNIQQAKKESKVALPKAKKRVKK